MSAIGCGGIGAIHWLAQQLGLPQEIDGRVHVLKAHRPYHESDHVLTLAYNALAGGQCLEDLELLRQDEAFLDALGADRIPDPTTAGDFCRRFSAADVEDLMVAINEARLRAWKAQPEDFFEEAVLDADGTLVETTGSCKEGMDVNYKKQWGYQVLLISLANTQEPLFLECRGGNRPSNEGAADKLDAASELCRRAGFRRVLMRGDTDFSQTAHLDRWDERGDRFIFGYGAHPALVRMANELESAAWKPFKRPERHEAKSASRSRPDNVREQVVRERGYRNVTLEEEHVTEVSHSPRVCEKSYRLIVLRKSLKIEKGQRLLHPEIRYFFYITNDRKLSPEEVVRSANQRCAQEGEIGELKSGVRALRAPVDNLISNWAYMVMASLAWSLKAWYALALPVSPRWRTRHLSEKQRVLGMGFRTFLNAFMLVPAQIVRTARETRYYLLAWNRWQITFLRALDGIRMLR